MMKLTGDIIREINSYKNVKRLNISDNFLVVI